MVAVSSGITVSEDELPGDTSEGVSGDDGLLEE